MSDLPASLDLETPNFRLRPFAPADRQDLFAHFADPRTVEFMDIDPLSDIAAADAIIAWVTELRAAGDGFRWTVRDASGGFVGTIGYNVLVREGASRGEVAYDVASARLRQGVMAEVLPVVLDFGYGALGLHRIEAMVTPGNLASRGLLERHGFRLEGLLRDYGFWKGRFWNQWLFARLARE